MARRAVRSSRLIFQRAVNLGSTHCVSHVSLGLPYCPADPVVRIISRPSNAIIVNEPFPLSATWQTRPLAADRSSYRPPCSSGDSPTSSCAVIGGHLARDSNVPWNLACVRSRCYRGASRSLIEFRDSAVGIWLPCDVLEARKTRDRVPVLGVSRVLLPSGRVVTAAGVVGVSMRRRSRNGHTPHGV